MAEIMSLAWAMGNVVAVGRLWRIFMGYLV